MLWFAGPPAPSEKAPMTAPKSASWDSLIVTVVSDVICVKLKFLVHHQQGPFQQSHYREIVLFLMALPLI